MAGARVTTICLAIPHTPWIKERFESMMRVREELCTGEARFYREFTERASNKVWPRAMWGWMLETGAKWCLTVQDDTIPAPCFWAALRAMLEHMGPRRVLGLSAVHPLGPSVAREGHRWYRTRSWLVGWAYAIHRDDLAEFVEYFDAHPEMVAANNEDELLNKWIQLTGRDVWHPVPTIIDHDTSIKSSYANDEHTHRRATVTWRDYGAASLSDPDFWLPSGEPQLLPMAWTYSCWFCQQEPGKLKSPHTGAWLGANCLANMLVHICGRL